jgi:hypothetical protein
VPARVLATFLTTLAAWLVVACQLSTALHFALISHHYCAAHGELVHGVAVAAEPTEAAADPSALPGGQQESDDHCPVLSRRVDRVAIVGATSDRLPPVPIACALPAVERDVLVVSRGELLLTAPKQSPPA